jgi:hypothetical protein
MTPGEIVDTFVLLSERCLNALLAQYDGMDRPVIWTGLFLRPRSGGDPVRSGALEGLGSFKIHGRGCQFELESGADVDMDWDDEGRAVFNSWRLMMYARSVGVGSVDQESLRVAASEATTLVQVGPDLFTWPDGRYDIIRGEV